MGNNFSDIRDYCKRVRTWRIAWQSGLFFAPDIYLNVVEKNNSSPGLQLLWGTKVIAETGGCLSENSGNILIENLIEALNIYRHAKAAHMKKEAERNKKCSQCGKSK